MRAGALIRVWIPNPKSDATKEDLWEITGRITSVGRRWAEGLRVSVQVTGDPDEALAIGRETQCGDRVGILVIRVQHGSDVTTLLIPIVAPSP